MPAGIAARPLSPICVRGWCGFCVARIIALVEADPRPGARQDISGIPVTLLWTGAVDARCVVANASRPLAYVVGICSRIMAGCGERCVPN